MYTVATMLASGVCQVEKYTGYDSSALYDLDAEVDWAWKSTAWHHSNGVSVEVEQTWEGEITLSRVTLADGTEIWLEGSPPPETPPVPEEQTRLETSNRPTLP